MNNSGTVRNALVEYLRSYSALDLPSICERLQIPCNSNLEPMHSKATYLKSGINKMKDKEIIELVKAIVSDNDCPELMEKIDRYLEEELFEITSNVIKLSKTLQRSPAINRPCVGMIGRFCQLSEVL